MSAQPEMSPASQYTREQVEAYYALRLDAFQLRRSGGSNQYTARCPFHDDNDPSLSVNLESGKFFCHAGACGIKGTGIHFFEMELLARDALGVLPEHRAVTESITRALGLPAPAKKLCVAATGANSRGIPRHKAQARYTYTDETGAELWTTYRFVGADGKKTTPKDRPCSCKHNPDAECEPGCHEGRVPGMGPRRVLYNWPSLIAAHLAFIVEGEKNADDLSAALTAYVEKRKIFTIGSVRNPRFAVTTNPDGAGGWRQDYAREFQSKIVIKLGDNDDAGRKHDEAVCSSVSACAARVYKLDLPDLAEHGDVSDFLAAHSIDRLMELLSTPALKPYLLQSPGKPGTEAPRKLLELPSKIAAGATETKTFWIDGLIEPWSRGMVIATAKAGKSLAVLDLAIALSTGGRFLGFPACPEKLKVAIISREDGPALVRSRLQQLAVGRGFTLEDLDAGILVNTEEQSADFKIDNPKHVEEMGQWLKRHEIQLALVDVLVNIHSADENKGMRPVMAAFDHLRTISGSQICVLHHVPKHGKMGARGDGSIESWWDWRIAIEPGEDDDSIKTFSFKTKAGSPPPPMTVRYYESADKRSSTIRLAKMGGAR